MLGDLLGTFSTPDSVICLYRVSIELNHESGYAYEASWILDQRPDPAMLITLKSEAHSSMEALYGVLRGVECWVGVELLETDGFEPRERNEERRGRDDGRERQGADDERPMGESDMTGGGNVADESDR